jgi:acyl-[acyl-carrier-protein]-phospholipid O-acyltransferase/long-chain-fatty-acid--[acyl-carrier-protein] ligase
VYNFTKTNSLPDDPAVILFTSGTESTPKGVVLSHKNLLGNCAQVSARVDFNASDVLFNALPLFHSFGLTGGTILPILSGIKTFFYPSPLHYRIVPEQVYEVTATIMFGTDTFLSGYAKCAHPYDFYSVRYVFAGAEKLKEETRKVWMEKFGVRIFEGYGVTEASPIVAVNTPMHYKPGTVGRLMPGIEYKLENIEGVEKGGKLWVKGINVMRGYLKEEAPGQLLPPEDGWYDTGDVVSIDGEGFVTIEGRVKRFAKIGGEMISLGAVEEFIYQLWPDHQHAVINLPDPKKGEVIVLLTTVNQDIREAMVQQAKMKGLSETMIPKRITIVNEIPLLGSGKTDYRAVKEIVEKMP